MNVEWFIRMNIVLFGCPGDHGQILCNDVIGGFVFLYDRTLKWKSRLRPQLTSNRQSMQFSPLLLRPYSVIGTRILYLIPRTLLDFFFSQRWWWHFASCVLWILLRNKQHNVIPFFFLFSKWELYTALSSCIFVFFFLHHHCLFGQLVWLLFVLLLQKFHSFL